MVNPSRWHASADPRDAAARTGCLIGNHLDAVAIQPRRYWRNVWTFTTIPSLREILLLSSMGIRAELQRRGSDGSWPAASTVIEDGDLTLESIDFVITLATVYRSTRPVRD